MGGDVMRPDRLAALMLEPKILRKILGTYKGSYSLGVTRVSKDSKDYALQLHVADDAGHRFPPSVKIADENVKIVVKTDFKEPQAFGGRRRAG